MAVKQRYQRSRCMLWQRKTMISCLRWWRKRTKKRRRNYSFRGFRELNSTKRVLGRVSQQLLLNTDILLFKFDKMIQIYKYWLLNWQWARKLSLMKKNKSKKILNHTRKNQMRKICKSLTMVPILLFQASTPANIHPSTFNSI